MSKKAEAPGNWLGRNLRKHFLTGILVVVPIGVIILALTWFFSTIDNLLQPVIKAILGQEITGLGFAISLVLIYLIGVFASNIVGRKLISFGESLLARVPVLRQLYAGIKGVMESLSGVSKAAFREVVLVEFPRQGMRTLAFITNELTDKSGKKLLTIYVPTAPNPTSGWLQIVSEDMVTHIDMPVDEAMTMIISSGMVSPSEIDTEASPKSKAPNL